MFLSIGVQLSIKRLLDVTISGICLVFFSPILLIVYVLVRLKIGTPVLFQQIRAGKHAQPFTLLKFRTMKPSSDDTNRPLSDEDAQRRLVKLGVFLREWSLDELPQLWNVLKGDMSLVGPRPLYMDYLPRYSPRQARRHDVKPGITGWAQVQGRNAISWDEKFEKDVWYVEHVSLMVDLKILWLTILKVVTREGISAQKFATMPEFMGSRLQDTTDAI
jgi:sugar transferase EpsL